jgi:hypothetical protein
MRMVPYYRFVGLLAVSFAGVLVGGLPAAIAQQPETAVYAAVLREAFGRRQVPRLVLADSTLVLPRTNNATDSDWIREYEAVPADLRARLGTLGRIAIACDRIGLPRRIVCSVAPVSRGVDSGGPQLGGLSTRERRLLGLSQVAFSADSSQALVYYEYVCGGLCGEGTALWLVRTSSGEWQVKQRVNFWIA